ncbi:MAG: hypothetical protein U0L54_03830 [Bacteroidales bacterium]|nr:hypothetical protein [Bacteroidales bacterium]
MGDILEKIKECINLEQEMDTREERIGQFIVGCTDFLKEIVNDLENDTEKQAKIEQIIAGNSVVISLLAKDNVDKNCETLNIITQAINGNNIN